MMIMALVNNRIITINVLLLVFACLAYTSNAVYLVVSEDGGKTLKVVHREHVVNMPPIYASAKLTGDIQQTG